MPQPENASKFQVAQNLVYQRKFWVFQRIGWVIMSVLILGAGLGFFGGNGPVNQASAENEQIEIQYKPYARRIASNDIELKIKSLSDSTVQLFIQQDFINNYEIQKIVPQPSDVKASGDMFIYEFSVAEGAETANVIFSLEPEPTTVGNVNGQLGLSSAQLVTINQLVYP